MLTERTFQLRVTPDKPQKQFFFVSNANMIKYQSSYLVRESIVACL